MATTNGTVSSTTLSSSTLSESTSTSLSSSSSIIITTSSISTSSTPVSTSVQVITPTTQETPLAPITVFKTSTSIASATPQPTLSSSQSSTLSSSSTTSAAAIGTGAAAAGGLSSGGKIAVAVVVPVAAVALIVFALLFLWRKRKQRRDAEEARRKEVEEYGYNPNQDPTLPAVGAVVSHGDQPYEMSENDGQGYRGWGTTPVVAGAGRKPSTTISGGQGPVGMIYSEGGTTLIGHGGSPGAGSDVHSNDPLLNSPHHTENSSTVGAMGGGPIAGDNRNNIHRGASNASSQYSAMARSELSGDGPLPPGAHPAQYYSGQDGPYEVDGNYNPPAGSYGEQPYGGYATQPPVIRDVQARRNTRIESPTVFPQQGNAGIAQNF